MTQALIYKLRMFCIQFTGPASLYYDNEALYRDFSITESVLTKKHKLVSCNACKEAISSDMIRVAREIKMIFLANLVTKIMHIVVRERFLDMFMY